MIKTSSGRIYKTDEKTDGKKRAALDILIHSTAATVFIFIAIASWEGLSRSIATMETMQSSVTVYRWPGRLAIFISSIAMIFLAVIRIIESVMLLKSSIPEKKEGI